MNTAAQRPPIRVLMLDTHGEYFAWASTLRQQGHHWDLLRVDSSAALISYLKENRYHAVVIAPSAKPHADLDCLSKATQLQPNAVRVMLPGMVGSPPLMSRMLELSHRLYEYTDSSEQIARSIEQQIQFRRLITKPRTRAFFSSAGPLPSPPRVYQELSRALRSEVSDAQKIAEIIEQDPALVARVLKMVNSAFFGLKRQISSVQQAVSLLGLRTLRGLALSGHLASLYPPNKNWSSFSFERMNQRALLVARLAQNICKDLKLNPSLQEQAFLAGLLHDIGILYSASCDPVRYQRVMQDAADNNVHLCTQEKRSLGFFHGETGAYLLALWNIPPLVVEAVLLHHTPHLSPDDAVTPLTAVHIADALIPPVRNAMDTDLSNRLSRSYLERTGVIKDLPRWQMRANSLHRSVLEPS
ncbi:HDOD domain-containing protein [Motiliproteus sp. SC1-56]|uniref:HDOD domain-containing protein n=1 Tax=Motiliproteus sp. SC1-56 TaxID=2799565 RepID=UPI001A8DF76D|nr:HDOD domain-containing protein [Motiliproteus sp. SC1-56]